MNQARIGSQPFLGNTVNYNNRTFNLGSSAYQPAYYRHSGYHGYWNGNQGYGGYGYGNGGNYGYGGGYGTGWGLGNGYGGYGGYGGGYGGYGGYGFRPFGWGFGGWGLGALNYNSGYLGYSNPYYIRVGNSGYNYSQPIQVSYNTSMAVPSGDVTADDMLGSAIVAFKQNDYAAALDLADQGIAAYPDDAVLHEFRGLVLFAKHDYQQAAATIHSILAIGPGWDWTTLSSLYADVGLYTEQLRALEAFTKSHPQDAASRFLLGYHYMSCGHPDAAIRPLQQVVKLMPSDRVAVDVLKMVTPPPAVKPGDETQEAPTPRPSDEDPRPASRPIDSAAKAVDMATLVGTWKAARADGSTFNLTMTDDAKFTWGFAPKGQPAQEFGGTYTVEGNVLALERKDGGSLIAAVTPSGKEKFNFKLVGGPADDTGLEFSR